jgi:hypothetical protein
LVVSGQGRRQGRPRCGKDVIAAAAARGSSSFATRIHPDALGEVPGTGTRVLPTKAFAGPMTEGIVARGRSVDLVLHDAEPEIAGYSAEEKRYIMRAQTRRAGPGETVCLPAEEIKRGFIADDDALPIERTTTGPTPVS